MRKKKNRVIRKKRIHPPALSEELRLFLEHTHAEDVSFDTLIRSLSRSSHAFFLIICSFPLCFPVGIPVVTTLLGLMSASVGFFLMIGKPPWIPRTLRKKAISPQRLKHVMERVVKICQKIEKMLHPRLPLIAENGSAQRIHGLFVMVLGLIAAIPLPLPFGNFVAALPIFLIGFGLAERDGLLILIAYITSILCFIYYGALAFLGFEGFERLFH